MSVGANAGDKKSLCRERRVIFSQNRIMNQVDIWRGDLEACCGVATVYRTYFLMNGKKHYL